MQPHPQASQAGRAALRAPDHAHRPPGGKSRCLEFHCKDAGRARPPVPPPEKAWRPSHGADRAVLPWFPPESEAIGVPPPHVSLQEYLISTGPSGSGDGLGAEQPLAAPLRGATRRQGGSEAGEGARSSPASRSETNKVAETGPSCLSQSLPAVSGPLFRLSAPSGEAPLWVAHGTFQAPQISREAE